MKHVSPNLENASWLLRSCQHILVAYSAFPLLSCHHRSTPPLSPVCSLPFISRLIRNILPASHIWGREQTVCFPSCLVVFKGGTKQPYYSSIVKKKKKKRKKNTKIYKICSFPYLCSYMTGCEGRGRGMGKACYLNREPVAKLNINTDPPTEK